MSPSITDFHFTDFEIQFSRKTGSQNRSRPHLQEMNDVTRSKVARAKQGTAETPAESEAGLYLAAGCLKKKMICMF